nr:hypothetical protein [Microbispora rosea]
MPGYLPLPPLVAHTRHQCGDDAAGCWSLSPWRSRAYGQPYAGPSGEQPGSTAAPRWAFAPPSVKAGVPSPSNVPATSSAPYARYLLSADKPAAGQAGCWAFSPSAYCARWD